MTTIAFDGRTIAADGMRTWGGEIRGLAHQKLLVRGKCIYAFTGLTPMFEPMVAWHVGGATLEAMPRLPAGPDEKGGWTLIVIDQKGLGKYTDSCPYPERFDPPIAFGAGGDYAIGAMLAGADAKRAVEIVSNLCNHTGGTIQAIDVEAFFGWAPAAPPVRKLLQEAWDA